MKALECAVVHGTTVGVENGEYRYMENVYTFSRPWIYPACTVHVTAGVYGHQVTGVTGGSIFGPSGGTSLCVHRATTAEDVCAGPLVHCAAVSVCGGAAHAWSATQNLDTALKTSTLHCNAVKI